MLQQLRQQSKAESKPQHLTIVTFNHLSSQKESSIWSKWDPITTAPTSGCLAIDFRLTVWEEHSFVKYYPDGWQSLTVSKQLVYSVPISSVLLIRKKYIDKSTTVVRNTRNVLIAADHHLTVKQQPKHALSNCNMYTEKYQLVCFTSCFTFYEQLCQVLFTFLYLKATVFILVICTSWWRARRRLSSCVSNTLLPMLTEASRTWHKLWRQKKTKQSAKR